MRISSDTTEATATSAPIVVGSLPCSCSSGVSSVWPQPSAAVIAAMHSALPSWRWT
jgi:hypothetical protein